MDDIMGGVFEDLLYASDQGMSELNYTFGTKRIEVREYTPEGDLSEIKGYLKFEEA